jgi:hypothetical protein
MCSSIPVFCEDFHGPRNGRRRGEGNGAEIPLLPGKNYLLSFPGEAACNFDIPQIQAVSRNGMKRAPGTKCEGVLAMARMAF